MNLSIRFNPSADNRFLIPLKKVNSFYLFTYSWLMSHTTQELGITLRRIKTGYKYLQKKQSTDVLISLYYSLFLFTLHRVRKILCYH